MINETMPMPEDNTLKVLEGLWWKHDNGVRGRVADRMRKGSRTKIGAQL
jgi:hypothetical protein